MVVEITISSRLNDQLIQWIFDAEHPHNRLLLPLLYVVPSLFRSFTLVLTVLFLYSWWCHLDDDNYLNPLALANTLAR